MASGTTRELSWAIQRGTFFLCEWAYLVRESLSRVRSWLHIDSKGHGIFGGLWLVYRTVFTPESELLHATASQIVATEWACCAEFKTLALEECCHRQRSQRSKPYQSHSLTAELFVSSILACRRAAQRVQTSLMC